MPSALDGSNIDEPDEFFRLVLAAVVLLMLILRLLLNDTKVNVFVWREDRLSQAAKYSSEVSFGKKERVPI